MEVSLHPLPRDARSAIDGWRPGVDAGVLGGDAQPASLPAALRRWRDAKPDALAFAYLRDGDAGEERIAYGSLAGQVGRLAGVLTRHGLAGQPVLILEPPGLPFLVAFFACLAAGVVAVPLHPPASRRLLDRLIGIIADAGVAGVIASDAVRASVLGMLPDDDALRALPWLPVATADGDGEAWLGDEPQRPALLQYTSGSTGTPKGVVITHGNLVDNSRRIGAAFGHGAHTVGVSWLPLCHDMGLIGNAVHVAHIGISCSFISPTAFLKKPLRWLEAISRCRATTSGGPDFAYRLLCDRTTPEERAGLDLSCWQVAYCGSETIRPATLQRFAELFAPASFRASAFLPCYGLAESTLIVSGGPPGHAPVVRELDAVALEQGRVAPAKEDARRRAVVGCGAVSTDSGASARIVDPATGEPLPADHIGEIWLRGPSVAAGYWRRPQETAEVFAARPGGGADGAAYLRTGDLGFIADGELFITGRIKDVVVVNGANHDATDLESAVQDDVPACRIGATAVFAIDDGNAAQVVVAQELDRLAGADLSALRSAIGAAIWARHGVRIDTVVFTRNGRLPRTTSGKLRRFECARLHRLGQLAEAT